MAQQQPYRLGARWVGTIGQAPGTGVPPIVEMVVASNNTAGLFRGDFLELLTGGTVYPSTVGGGTNPHLSYVMDSVKQYLGSDGVVRKGTFLPAKTTYTGVTAVTNPLASIVLCIPVTNQLFALAVPTAEADATAATGKIGKCIDIGVGSGGSTVTGLSSMTAGTTFEGSGGSAQLRLERIPTYGLNGAMNDPTKTYWEGWFSAYETLVTV